MTQVYILNMANHELLRKIAAEQKRLEKFGEYASPLLTRYFKEEEELHQMIYNAEQEIEKA